MIFDPKLMVAGLCFVIASFVFALMMRHLKRLRTAAATPSLKVAPFLEAAPVALAKSDVRPTTSFHGGKPRVEGNGSKLISIVHDFGHHQGHQTDERRYLSTREAFEILAEIRSVGPDTPIDVVLHTPGGEGFACELIAMALKDRPNTTAYVPYCAMSAGTIIALATEKVVMGRYACLGPIDTQFFGFPIESFARLRKEKPIENIDDFTVLLTYLAEKELKTARQRACELLNKNHFGNDDACHLTDFLVSGDLPHSEQIARARAIELGVNVVDGDCPSPVYELVEARLKLFKTMGDSVVQGPGFDDNKAKMLEDRRAAFVAPPVMWRKP